MQQLVKLCEVPSLVPPLQFHKCLSTLGTVCVEAKNSYGSVSLCRCTVIGPMKTGCLLVRCVSSSLCLYVVAVTYNSPRLKVGQLLAH